jgi:Ca2+-binding EF-hand superfamily protein
LQNQVRVQADDQPDALFPSLDSNSDGRLDGREIARIGHRLAQMDRDRDGQVALHEIPGSMAVGVARGNPQDQTLFAVPLALPRPNEKAPRWFLSMDRNRDGGISAAEFLGHRDSFATLDANQDGFVDCHEALATKAD